MPPRILPVLCLYALSDERCRIMKRLVLREVTDYSDFLQGRNLIDFLKQNSIATHRYNNKLKGRLSHIRVSPDGEHIHIIVNKPKSTVLTFDKREKHAHVQHQQHSELDADRAVSVVDVVYLDSKGRDGGKDVLAVIFEDGKADFWQYCEQRPGWHLLHTSEFSRSPRTKVVSVSAGSNYIVWCEEAASVDNAPACGMTQMFRFRICRQTYNLEDSLVHLGQVQIMLYNNPRYVMVTSGDIVYILPDPEGRAFRSISGFFLTWSPQHGSVSVVCACKGILLTKELPNTDKGCDFTQLILDCPTLSQVCDPLQIHAFSPAGCNSLVFLMSSGWVTMMDNNGVLRRVYNLADGCGAQCGDHVSMSIYHNWLVLITRKVLYVIDVQCGLEVERMLLNRDALLFVNCQEKHVPHFLSESGMFLVRPWEHSSSHAPDQDESQNAGLDSVLREAIFEEACRYYQRRSLCATQLTVDKLIADGKFQTPLLLWSILTDYLKGQKDSHLVRLNSRECGRLLDYMDPSLRCFVLLQNTKVSVIMALEDDLAGYREMLVRDEVSRLLSSDLDAEDVHHLNFLFDAFPSEAWRITQVVLQLTAERDGSFSAKVPPDVWRTVLAPIVPGGYSMQHSSPGAVALPAFELLCRSFLRFQPQWLPRFLELAQKRAGISMLTPSLTPNYGQQLVAKDIPLYKRALSVLPGCGDSCGLEVELLLCSQRPNGVLQALQLLIDQHQWGRVLDLAEQFCPKSLLLGKEIFTALLRETSQSRDLNPHLGRLWALCPVDMTVSSILEVILESLPMSSPLGPQPFCVHSGHLTVGLLKPLLGQMLQSENPSSQGYAEVLCSLVSPPPVPLREPRGIMAEVGCLCSKQNVSVTPLLFS